LITAHILQTVESDEDIISMMSVLVDMTGLQQMEVISTAPVVDKGVEEDEVVNNTAVLDETDKTTEEPAEEFLTMALTMMFANREDMILDFSQPLIFRLFKDGRLVASVSRLVDAEKAVMQTVFGIKEEEIKKT